MKEQKAIFVKDDYRGESLTELNTLLLHGWEIKHMCALDTPTDDNRIGGGSMLYPSCLIVLEKITYTE